MTLSEINIKDALLYHTNKLITESNYPTLRQALLERKALPAVLHSIDFIVHEHCTIDKHLIKQQATQDACATQITSDNKQYQTDEQQRSQDYALIAEYNIQLPILQSRLRSLDTDYMQQQNRYNGVQNQVDDLKRKLHQINSQINQLQFENRFTSGSHRYTSYHASTYNIEIPYQVHYHYPQQDFRLMPLQQQRPRLISLITTAERQAYQERGSLNNLGQEKRRVEGECRTMNHALQIEFPQKEHQRALRDKQRSERATARSAHDLDLGQLSADNREALQKKIQSKCQDLDSLREQLKEAALAASYDTYLNQLDNFLIVQPTTLAININERVALKQINDLMTGYSQLEQQAHLINHSLSKAHNKLSQLQRFMQENEHLAQDNAALTITRDGQRNNRNTALFIALFGSTKIITSSGIIGSSMLFVNPLLLVVPASFALIVAISITAALVYHYKKASSEQQITVNQQKMRDNESALFEEEGITNTPVPNLNHQIAEVQQQITQIEAQKISHQQVMGQVYHQAQSISVHYMNSNSFFPHQPSNVYYLAPSAPPEEPGQQTPSYGPAGY